MVRTISAMFTAPMQRALGPASGVESCFAVCSPMAALAARVTKAAAGLSATLAQASAAQAHADS